MFSVFVMSVSNVFGAAKELAKKASEIDTEHGHYTHNTNPHALFFDLKLLHEPGFNL